MRQIFMEAAPASGSSDYQAQENGYVLADTLIPLTSIILSILACKAVNELTNLISNHYFETYSGLTKIQKMEWTNRGLSTVHAFYITNMSLYFVFWSDLFSDNHDSGLITFRSSPSSTFTLGVSVGYFFVDLGTICWQYPSLGGMEYILHHSLSAIAVAYSMISKEGQFYTFMVLISEMTTPEINLRWYLDVSGLKSSMTYLVNGIVIFFTWLVARILLFGYMFHHVYLHHHQVAQMHKFGYILVFGVPIVLAAMNMMWFAKILRGLKKTVMKRM